MRSASLPPGSALSPELLSRMADRGKWVPSDVPGVEVRCTLGAGGTWHKHLRVCATELDWDRFCDKVDRLTSHVHAITRALRANTNATLRQDVFDDLAEFSFDLSLHLRVLEAVARLHFQRDHRHRTSLTLLPPQHSVGSVKVKYFGEGEKPLCSNKK